MNVHGFNDEHIKNLLEKGIIPCDMCIDYIYKDLHEKPFLNHSIVFPATQFALYAGFTKIYLVGCDCTGYFHSNNFKTKNSLLHSHNIDNCIVHWWKCIYNFKNTHYQNTQIISINPVGLKNTMDEDIYT